jgi:hypothetical protein
MEYNEYGEEIEGNQHHEYYAEQHHEIEDHYYDE